MGLATTTVKHILLLLNFVFTILGLTLIGFGIFILLSAAQNRIDHGENVAGALIITLGAVILIIAIFGCLAAIHESRNKLTIYIVGLVVLILLQLIMASMASQGNKDGLSGSVEEGFETLWEYEHKSPGSLAYYEGWLHCCGVNNTDDYQRIHHDIPKSCCKQRNCDTHLADNVYREGCQSKFEEYLADKMFVFSIVSWIIIIAEIVGAVFAWLLLSSLKNRSRRANVGWM